MKTVLIMGLGGQGALADAPGSGNENKVISYAKAFRQHGCFDIYGMDTDPKKLELAQKYWGVKPATLDSYDVVVIATPDETHYEMLKYAIVFNSEIVMCEKPLCTNSKQASEVARKYASLGVGLFVDCTRNYIPEFMDMVREHGYATELYCTFNRGWMHTAIHAQALLRKVGTTFTHVEFKEVPEGDRVWDLKIVFPDGYVFEEVRNGDDPVHPRYDFHMKHVADAIYEALNTPKGKDMCYKGITAARDILKLERKIENKSGRSRVTGDRKKEPWEPQSFNDKRVYGKRERNRKD